MARNPFRGRLTNAPRRAAKRQRAKNSRWMHLGAAEIGTRQKIQRCWAGHTLATTNSLFLAGYALGLRAVLVGPLPAATQQMVDYLLRQAAFFAWHVTQWTSLDVFLFYIPRTEFQYRREFRRTLTKPAPQPQMRPQPWRPSQPQKHCSMPASGSERHGDPPRMRPFQ